MFFVVKYIIIEGIPRSFHLPQLPSLKTPESQTRHQNDLISIPEHRHIHPHVTNHLFTEMFFAPGLPILNVTMLFFLMLNLLPLVPASPCSTHSPNNVFTHKDSLSTPGPSIEVMSRLGPGVPLPPLWASASEATIVPLQPAADATSGHIPSIPTQDPSPFYHNSRSSWRSEDIANVLLGGITTLAALLALGTKYILIPLCTRGRQSGTNQAIAQG